MNYYCHQDLWTIFICEVPIGPAKNLAFFKTENALKSSIKKGT